ncbi:metallophosphoesterase family protein [Nocardioides sp. TF02-7]|uniref:metallophosphoesterase family protein n=1 Tax=Nocardioides sp. TF02-7 TaxID=2917724 RepID=UPI0023DC6EE4|nr:metallophosphoesterase family protein [Nocardioides sp. TF02-7]
MRWWRDQLGPGQAEWLRSRPFSHDLWMSGRRVRLLHASPDDVHRKVWFDHDEDGFLDMFRNTPLTGDGPVPDVVAYGDTHDPYLENDRGRRTLVNVGSVGNCIGDPTPVYVVLEGVADGTEPAPFSVAFVRVPYDHEAELAHAAAVGMPELDAYALELREGVYRGHLPTGVAPYHRRPATVPAMVGTPTPS